MKEKSHRVSRRCYRSGVWSLRGTQTRRLDGHSLYSASHVPIRAERQAGGRGVRHSGRQLGRWSDPAEGHRHSLGADQAFGGVPGRRAPAGEGPARDDRIAPAARVRARGRLRRLQRRRAAGGRRHPQACGRPRSDRGARPRLAADALALRERRGPTGIDRDGARPGRHRDRAPSPATQGPGHADHDRPRPHRRSHARPARVQLLQRALRHLVLPAGGGRGDVQRGDRAIRRRGGAPTGQCAGPSGGTRTAAPAASSAAGRLSERGLPRAAGWRLLEREQVEYVVAMPSNARLDKRARRLMGKARVLSRTTGRTAHLYGETRYAARTWKRKRRVIIKAEVVRHPGRAPKNNPRFVVTNLPDDPEAVYQLYCQRGDVENRLKELHHGLELDRTSCCRFLANQLRVLLTLAAYILFQELRRRAVGTACADAQVTTLRERLLKLAVWVERSVRRIVLHLPRSFPWLPTWWQVARAVGATS